ncbi:CaiB/BaiF CoA-transferase family protein [Saccharopolyspora sp. NPDC049426]|uniref:CaiB/BaiF CoA transferase family protein n=1 Tax=Saccharopolyspora sp. NPDC049426 TaxID=3155652 RepID=UPI00343A6ED8
MLEDVKVLSFTHYLQGPSAVQILGDLGADVIKIERPEGAYERHWSGGESFVGGESMFYLLAGRNQRSLALDVRSEEGKKIVWDLIERADVIVENFRPGVMERLGLGYEAASAVNPGIVYCSLTGYGSEGPYRDKPGQDLLIQALSGLAMQSGRADTPPTPVGSAVVDQHAAVWGALGVLAALHRRRTSGEGGKVDSNLFSAALDLQIEPLNYHLNGTDLYDRSASGISSRFHQAPYGVFATFDEWVCLSLNDMKTMGAVFDDAEMAEWTKDDQFRRREDVNSRIAQHLRTKSLAHWKTVFDERGVWYAPVNDYDAIEDDPQVAHNGSVLSFEHPRAGKVRVLAHPVKYDGQTPGINRIPPSLGEHTAEILRDLGRTEAEIDQLIDGKIVRTNSRA